MSCYKKWGRQIVRRQSPQEPGNCSRLWEEADDLQGCVNSLIFAPSKKLSLLNLKGCTSLTTLPGKTFMKSLKTLVLSGCLKLKKFPDIVQVLWDGTDIRELSFAIELLFRLVPEFPEKTSSKDQLLVIHLEGTALRGLPASIELLSGNVLLNLKDCKNLKSLPSTINGLRSLRMLHLSGCSKLKNAPETLGKVESLEAKMQNDFDCGTECSRDSNKVSKSRIAKKDSDSWKKNVDKGIKLSTTAISACSLACHRLIQTSRAMPKS
ncbi:hypothetical protein WN944_015338 [Citrus x changshan-huyou]|uniref:Uncharacterized protein n=1 Tax=Citrus x changshan-huyou TaxID=2935761 RepID=A0AAP0M9N1_9ROSI